MPRRDIVVIGASAGGVEAITQLVQQLPKNLPAALIAVLHLPAGGFSVLPQILSRVGALPALHPADCTPIEPGQIYVAPPNRHLLVQRGKLRLSSGPRENGFRPSIDVLFRSAARCYQQRVMGVILSGTLDDGTAGLSVIKSCGGIALVQDPEEAMFNGMPCSAIDQVAIDRVLPIYKLAEYMVELVLSSQHDPVDPVNEAEAEMAEDELRQEAEIVAHEKTAIEQGERSGSASTFTCPDCGGVLWELSQGNILRYRCHIGHAYSSDSLLLEQADSVEIALWSSVRALEEKAALSRRMATHARRQNRLLSEVQFTQRAEEAERQAEIVRQVILAQTRMSEPEEV